MSNEPQIEPYVRTDVAQAFNDTRRMRARTNIRAARQPDIDEALVYGLTGASGSFTHSFLYPLMDDPGILTITAVGADIEVIDITTADLASPVLPSMPYVIADGLSQDFSVLAPIGPEGITIQVTTNLGVLDIHYPYAAGGSTAGGTSDGADSVIRIYLTPTGNWSSDGTDTAPGTGIWYLFDRSADTQTYDATEDDEGELASTSTTFVHYDVSRWVDGVQDTTLAWKSEVIDQSLAADLFAFRAWYPVPDLENTEWEDEAVQTQLTIVIVPVEKPLLQVKGSSAITDEAMTALGFTHQVEVTDGVSVWFVPASGTAWS